MSRRAISLRERPFDLLIIAFFVINLLFITYIVDDEWPPAWPTARMPQCLRALALAQGHPGVGFDPGKLPVSAGECHSNLS
ncbi:MAG TPA: hypothetical protein VFW17_15210 [Ktedonobacterales bacterium]|jgi:hypothetical protein|nr:hypothetical protein [Ktedonobacterales bacterium]